MPCILVAAVNSSSFRQHVSISQHAVQPSGLHAQQHMPLQPHSELVIFSVRLTKLVPAKMTAHQALKAAPRLSISVI